jgi:hypothetical protein
MSGHLPHKRYTRRSTQPNATSMTGASGQGGEGGDPLTSEHRALVAGPGEDGAADAEGGRGAYREVGAADDADHEGAVVGGRSRPAATRGEGGGRPGL